MNSSKYQRSCKMGCKVIGIGKSEFVAKNQMLFTFFKIKCYLKVILKKFFNSLYTKSRPCLHIHL